MLMSLLSLFGGGIMRMLPELIGLWGKKTDNAHELSMLSVQVELEKVKAAAQQVAIKEQSDADQILHALDAQKDALADQMKQTGIKIVDALNALVRPLTTYYFLLLFGIYKAALLGVAMQQATSVWTAILQVYTPNDESILFGILSFWFVGRVFDKKA